MEPLAPRPSLCARRAPDPRGRELNRPPDSGKGREEEDKEGEIAMLLPESNEYGIKGSRAYKQPESAEIVESTGERRGSH